MIIMKMMKKPILALMIFAVVAIVSVRSHHGDDKLSFNDVNNELTVKLLQTLTEDDNAVFSPVILANTWLLLANSVFGAARDELLQSLALQNKDDLDHVNADAKVVWQHRSHLLPLSVAGRTASDKTLFDLLPKLLVRSDQAVRDSIRAMAKENYPTDIYKLPAAAESSEEVQRSETRKINEWFAQKSATGTIGRMLDDNELTNDIRLLALTAAAFKGSWKGNRFVANQSSAAATEDDFHNVDGKPSKIAFMHSVPRSSFRVLKDDTEHFVGIELPFTDHLGGGGHRHHVKLVLIMPTEIATSAPDTMIKTANVDKMIDSFDRDSLRKLLMRIAEAPHQTPATFKLPKLHFEKDYELKDAMTELNVKSLFDTAEANFSALVQSADGSSSAGLALSQLDHKAIVQWNEDSDRSADSADTTTTTVAAEQIAEAIAINKPFIFFIVDVSEPSETMPKPKPMIIFAGRIKTLTKDSTFPFN